uniref:Uncharacterized protein n=1 Tax=Fundulus heteroclitus TaxID=8078 RepID=A0A3Q2UHR9_FUNHE
MMKNTSFCSCLFRHLTIIFYNITEHPHIYIGNISMSFCFLLFYLVHLKLITVSSFTSQKLLASPTHFLKTVTFFLSFLTAFVF